jgi:hypothetical protein
MKKVIKYIKTCQYGVEREFIHSSCAGDAQIIQQLTGQKTINSRIRELLRDLTAGFITFEQVLN